MIALTVGLLLISLVSGLPAPRPEALPLADPEPLPVADPEPDAEADAIYGLGYGGLPYGGLPYGGVVEALPPIFVEGVVEEVVVGPPYPGINARLG